MAMEDAVCLADKITEAAGAYEQAFQAYQQQRYLRTTRVQLTSRLYGHVFHAEGAAADLRKAFEAAIRDPDLLSQAAKMKLDIDVISGDEIKGAVEALYTAKPETLKRSDFSFSSALISPTPDFSASLCILLIVDSSEAIRRFKAAMSERYCAEAFFSAAFSALFSFFAIRAISALS